MLATARLHEGPTLRLRRVVPDDATLLFGRLYRDDAFRRLYSRRARVDDVEALRAHIAAQWPDGPERTGHLAFVVEHLHDGPIGVGALTNHNPVHRRAELLLGLFDPARRGAGHASEATCLLLDLAFNAYGLNKLACQVYDYNPEVRHILAGYGFTLEATRRQHLRLEDRSYADLHVYGLTEGDMRGQAAWSLRSRRVLGYDITRAPLRVDEAPQAPASTVARPSRAARWASAVFGATLLVPQLAAADTFDVTEATDDGTGGTEGTLSWAIRQANVNPGPDAIKLATDVTLSGPMTALVDGEPSGGDHDEGGGALSIRSDGIRRTLDGADTWRPLFVLSGTLVIEDVTIANGKALGGSGGSRGRNGIPNRTPRGDIGGGGAGGGFGGGLFVHSGNVILRDVDFVANNATGGSADRVDVEGGGGMFGAGSGGGGGLFGAAAGAGGGYGGSGHYGGYGGVATTPGQLSGGFGGGGARSFQGVPGVGGFGGGGGDRSAGGWGGGGGGGIESAGRDGGFGGGGGGGGYYVTKDAYSGWAGGAAGYGGRPGGTVNCTYNSKKGWNCTKNRTGGGGAGFGGAIFARSGTVSAIDVTFTDNSVVGGSGNGTGTAAGADIFVCTADLHATAAGCAGVVNACGTTAPEHVKGTLGTGCPAELPCVEDSDGDGTCDERDACPFSNPDDADEDGVCDNIDLCAGDDATGDEDGDGTCNDEDACSGDNDSGDTDGDGVCDDIDPCPLDNADDSDGDGSCDSADLCVGDDTSGDTDADGVCESDDPCPVDNPDDTDDDGVCDSVDPCPVDNLDDSDGDGSCDADDLCVGNDAAGDPDGDGVCTDVDPCPFDNPDDSDDDGVCDSADVCVGNNTLGDLDADGICGREGCGCASTPVPTRGLWVGMLGLLGLRRRRS